MLGKLNKHFSISLANKHRWNTNTSACSIVAHDHVGDIFDLAVDHNEKTGTSTLSIAHLIYECAATAFRNKYLRRESFLVALRRLSVNIRQILGVTPRAHIRVLLVKVNCTNLYMQKRAS